MKALTLDMAKKWGSATVILSPRDMSTTQLLKWCRDFQKANIACLFDPQCYCPKGDPKRLTEYSYWDANLNTNLQIGENTIEKQLRSIKEYNDIAETKAYILPCILNPYSEDWEKTFIFQTSRYIETAQGIMNNKPIYATLALPNGFLMQSEDTIEPVLQKILNFKVDGFYLIAEALDRKYLIDNPIWLSNVLSICAALKISGKKIIYGYGNHQMLPLALTKVDAIASGTWQNVRSFTNRFIEVDEQKRRSIWVYYPKALSEYKLSFLDWASNIGELESMKSEDKHFMDDSINKIFQSTIHPSATGFTETDAFKHYLICLKHQIELLNKGSYNDTFNSYELMLTTAEREIERLEKVGVYAQGRSFKNFVDVNRAAISRLHKNHGFALGISWNSI